MSGQLDTSLVFLVAKGVFRVCTKILIFQKSWRQESSHFAGLLVGPGFRALPGPLLLIRNGPLGVTENGRGSSVGRNEGGARRKWPWSSSRNSEVVSHSRGFPKEGGQCNHKMGKEERFSFSLSSGEIVWCWERRLWACCVYSDTCHITTGMRSIFVSPGRQAPSPLCGGTPMFLGARESLPG